MTVEIPQRLLMPYWTLGADTGQVEFAGRRVNPKITLFLEENAQDDYRIEEYNEGYTSAGVRVSGEECDMTLLRLYFGF